jgi:hypothetical protein
MKVLLALQVCSAVLAMCEQPNRMGVEFGNHYECAVGGYSIARTMMEEFGEKKVNDERIIIQFACLEQEVEDA